jgi:hypothetical protein
MVVNLHIRFLKLAIPPTFRRHLVGFGCLPVCSIFLQASASSIIAMVQASHIRAKTSQ